MKCSYCGKDVPSNEVVLGDLSFCNNLCRYLWQKNETVNQTAGERKTPQIFFSNFDFQINLPNFNKKKLILCCSYFTGPKLYFNTKKIKPSKREIIKRKKTYHIKDDNGQTIEIILKNRLLDAIPSLIINGKEIEISKKLIWYEYVFISIPAILIFIGGVIGAIIGGAAMFVNSIILRKINPKALSYSLVGINLVLAFIFFFKAIIFVAPFITEFQFRSTYSTSAIKNNSELLPLTKHVWETYKLTNMENVDISDQGINIIGSKRYFFGDGNITYIMNDGTLIVGKWNVNKDGKTISFLGTKGEEKVEIINLTDSELIIRFNNINIYHRAI